MICCLKFTLPSYLDTVVSCSLNSSPLRAVGSVQQDPAEVTFYRRTAGHFLQEVFLTSRCSVSASSSLQGASLWVGSR